MIEAIHHKCTGCPETLFPTTAQYIHYFVEKNKSSYVITFQSTNEFHTINCCQSCQGQTCKITLLIQCCYVVFRARTWACVTDWLGTNVNLAVKHTDLKWDNPPTPFTQPNHLDRKWQRLGGGQVPFLSADSMMDTDTSYRCRLWRSNQWKPFGPLSFFGCVSGHPITILSPSFFSTPPEPPRPGWRTRRYFDLGGCHHQERRGRAGRAPATTFKRLHQASGQAGERAHAVHTSCIARTWTPNLLSTFLPLLVSSGK